MEPLNIQILETNRLIPYSRNAKTHPKEQIEKIAKQISDVGFLVPIIVDKELTVISGHGRLLAAHALGLERVPVVIADHLTEDQALAFRIADNKVAESPWDLQLLGFELKTLEMHDVDLTCAGISMEEARGIISMIAGSDPTPEFQAGTADAQSQLDQPKLIRCPNCEHEFSPGA